MLRRQGSLTPGSNSPKVDWKSSAGLGAGNKGGGQGVTTIRRSLSVGSALSDFLGSSSSRKSLEINSSMKRSGSKGCLESLEASSNFKAISDGDDRWERFEEECNWNFATLENTNRSGGTMHNDTFPSVQLPSQEWHGLGKNKAAPSFPRPGNSSRTELQRTFSMGHTVPSKTPKSPQKSVVVEQAQQSFDSLKDRLDSSLRMQPECSYGSAKSPPVVKLLPAPPTMDVSPRKDVRFSGIVQVVSGLNLSALPRSLKRRKNKEKNMSRPRLCAMSNGFSAMAFIIKSMHRHVLEMQEDHLLNLVTPMHRDMDLSFSLLFQQVFARTPEYMLAVMVLLAEFSVLSLGKHMAFAAAVNMANPEVSLPDGISASSKKRVESGVAEDLSRRQEAALSPKPGNSHIFKVPTECFNGSFPKLSAAEESIMLSMMSETVKQLEADSGWQPVTHVDREVTKMLVAPVQATLSPDNYPCFDRTDLEYQHAISLQPNNVMLLSNYAQFLYVVRHDNNMYDTSLS